MRNRAGMLLSPLALAACALILATMEVAPHGASIQGTPPATGFPSYNPAYPPPPDWKGLVFQLSQNYPKRPPRRERLPWKRYNFRTQPREYLMAIQKYVYEGNINRGRDANGNSLNWQVRTNPVRTWYHMPWRHWGDHGREFVHGMTLEFPSLPGTLDPSQKKTHNTYALAMYSPLAAYTIGQVWSDPTKPPNLNHVLFRDGALIAKLLFTTAEVTDVPEVRDDLSWQANIYTDPKCFKQGCPREVRRVRLFQMDVAVKESRAKETAWVFGTFVYKADQPGAKSVWEKMVPLGLMWGVDPQLTSADSQGKPKQSTVFEVALYEHLGCHKRLSGPLDNPNSACMSCHMTAQYPGVDPIPSSQYPCDDPQNSKFWQNLLGGKVFEQQSEPTYALDYSMEMASGVQNYFLSQSQPVFSPDRKTYTLPGKNAVYQVIRRQN